jgi:hypothetical protein
VVYLTTLTTTQILDNEELYDLYVLSNIIRVVESGIMGLAGYVAGMFKRRGVYKMLVGNTERQREPGTCTRG